MLLTFQGCTVSFNSNRAQVKKVWYLKKNHSFITASSAFIAWNHSILKLRLIKIEQWKFHQCYCSKRATFSPVDSPYIHSYFNLSTTANSWHWQQPLMCSPAACLWVRELDSYCSSLGSVCFLFYIYILIVAPLKSRCHVTSLPCPSWWPTLYNCHFPLPVRLHPVQMIPHLHAWRHGLCFRNWELAFT